MPNYKCKPWCGNTVFSPTFQVVVSERLSSMPYAQCGFIDVMSPINNHNVRIFVSYITPVFAVIDDEYIVRIWCGKSPTTSRQITNALKHIYSRYCMSIVDQHLYHKCCPLLYSGIALNLDNGYVLRLGDEIVDFLMSFSPPYTKISD